MTETDIKLEIVQRYQNGEETPQIADYVLGIDEVQSVNADSSVRMTVVLVNRVSFVVDLEYVERS